MTHYLIRLDNQPSKASDLPAFTEFLRIRQWVGLIGDYHGQTFGLITSEESPDELRLGITLHLVPHAQVFLRQIPTSALPVQRSDYVKWVTENASSGQWL